MSGKGRGVVGVDIEVLQSWLAVENGRGTGEELRTLGLASTTLYNYIQNHVARMPREEKKVKAIKSHYSHETRKDVELVQLQSLKLDTSWPLIRREVELEMGPGLGISTATLDGSTSSSSSSSSSYVCVPYLGEAGWYGIGAVLAEEKDDLGVERLRPAGRLLERADTHSSDADYLAWLRNNSFNNASFDFPHDSVKITLQDENAMNKVRVIMLNFSRLTIPADKSPVNKITLNLDSDLEGVKSVYIVTDVLMAKTVEFRANTGTSSRIFHIGNPTPLIFHLEKFDVNKDGLLISQKPVAKKPEDTQWCRVDTRDQLLVPPQLTVN